MAGLQFFRTGPQAWPDLGCTTLPKEGNSSVLAVSGAAECQGALRTTKPWGLGFREPGRSLDLLGGRCRSCRYSWSLNS